MATSPSAVHLTNYSFGDFLLGLPNPSYFAVTGPQMDARTVQWGAYGQDAWQVNSHLTVNFGLRWELLPPFQETNGDIATYLTTGNNLTVVVPDKFYHFIANNPLPTSRYTRDFFRDSTPVRFRVRPRCSRVRTSRRPARRGFLKAFGIGIGVILTRA